MKKSKLLVWRLGIAALVLGVLLSGCVVIDPNATPTPTDFAPSPENPAYPAYPPADTPAIDTPAYPEPQETGSPDDPVTGPSDPIGEEPGPGGPASGVPPEFAPQPADAALQRGEVFLDEDGVDILILESFPPQFNLRLVGSLPTPCHQLRVTVEPPNDQGEILVSAYTVVDPGQICTQVLEPFETTISLREVPSGTFMVVVNGEPAGEIDMP
jgi:hypothetical protein